MFSQNQIQDHLTVLMYTCQKVKQQHYRRKVAGIQIANFCYLHYILKRRSARTPRRSARLSIKYITNQ